MRDRRLLKFPPLTLPLPSSNRLKELISPNSSLIAPLFLSNIRSNNEHIRPEVRSFFASLTCDHSAPHRCPSLGGESKWLLIVQLFLHSLQQSKTPQILEMLTLPCRDMLIDASQPLLSIHPSIPHHRNCSPAMSNNCSAKPGNRPPFGP